MTRDKDYDDLRVYLEPCKFTCFIYHKCSENILEGVVVLADAHPDFGYHNRMPIL